MQPLSTALEAALVLRDGTNDPIQRQPAVLYEIYPFDYLPNKGDPFDPAEAIALFSEVGVTWLGYVYSERVLSRGPISRFISTDFNRVDLTFSNGDLVMSSFIVQNDVEGMRLVIRYIDQAIEQSLENSCVMSVERLEKPSSITEEDCTIGAAQDLATINYEIPKRTFSSRDPRGRSSADPEYEGFQFSAMHGMFKYTTVVTKRFLGFFTKKKIETQTQQWSSETGTTQDQVVPLIFGRCQMELIAVLWADIGFFITGLWIGAGHKVTSFSDVTIQSPNFLTDDQTQKFTQAYIDAHTHLGDPGGTGTNATPETVDGTLSSNPALLSRTAYLGLKPFGPENPTASSPNAGEDAVPTITAIMLGEADLPDVDNNFVNRGFTDNPAYLTRFVLTDPDIIGLDPRLIDDDECVLTAAICDEILIDDTNAEILALMTPDATALTSGLFTRFNSSGIVDTKYQRYQLGDIPDYPQATPRLDPLPIEPPDDDSCPPGQHLDIVTGLCVPDDESGVLAPSTTFYRRRYTFNAPLTAKVKAIDFLLNTLLPSFRGYITIGPDGRLKIKSERPADSSFIRDNAAAGSSIIAVNDIEPWRTSKQGLILIYPGSVISETRKVTGASYSSAGALISLVGAGTGITLTASGGTLGGGSSTVPYSGTLTVSGTPNAGDLLTATIDGIAVQYALTTSDTLNSSAAMLAAAINAIWSLKAYVRATHSGAVVTIYSKLGNLTLATPLTSSHVALLDSPLVAPAASAVSGGGMRAGIYDLAYAWTTPQGETFVSPRQQLTLSAGQRISVSTLSLPSGASGVNWYLSKAPNDSTLAFFDTNVGSAFYINSLPDPDASGVPIANGAGEETIRVMASFTEENIREHKFKWPLADKETSTNQILIKYREASADFAERELYVNDRDHQRRINATNKVEIDGSGVDNYNQAFRLANSRLSKEREGNFFCEWDTDEAGIAFEEGDVVCITDTTGGFINLPLRLETLQIQENLDVTFTGRLYSTIMYSDQTGQHPITIPTTLKYTNTAPPDATNVVLTEETDPLTVSTIRGKFDFGDFPIGQRAQVYAIKPGETDYTLIDTVLPDEDNIGSFDLATIGPGTYKFKIVTESKLGFTKGLTAATEHDKVATSPGVTGTGDALTSNPLSQFAATTSAQLRGVLTDETGTGAAVFADSPALVGTPSAPTASPGTNTTQISTTAFVKAAVDLAVTGLLDFKGSTDCSANPNYPAASKGDAYIVTVAGKIGGASGKSVDVGDVYVASTDNAGGTEGSVGTSWFVLEHNLVGALLSANNLSDLASASTARSNLGLVIGTNVAPVASPSFTGDVTFADNLKMNGASTQTWTDGKVLYGPTSGFFIGNSGDVHFTSNCRVDNSAAHGWRYVATGPAVDLYLYNGNCVVRKIASGSAGADLDWTSGSSVTVI